MLAKFVATELGVDFEHVKVVIGETQMGLFSLFGMGGSQMATIASGAALFAAIVYLVLATWHVRSKNRRFWSPIYRFLGPFLEQMCQLALLDNGLEETTENLDAVARANTGETGMVGKRLAQVVAKVPQNAEPVCCMPHQLAFGTNALEKHHELQLEEDHWIYRRTTTMCIGLLHELTRHPERSSDFSRCR
jgi:hypothetical protein